MMFPPVYRTLRTPAVVAIVDDRIGAFGEVAQDEQRPYITWQVIVDAPHDHLSGAPPSDFTTVQIDCYAKEQKDAETLAMAVRAALDAELIVNRVSITGRDRDTRLYRVSLDADFITQR